MKKADADYQSASAVAFSQKRRNNLLAKQARKASRLI
jgi:hypothetical protein